GRWYTDGSGRIPSVCGSSEPHIIVLAPTPNARLIIGRRSGWRGSEWRDILFNSRARCIEARAEMSATSEDFVHPEYLVETEWLAEHLGQSDLRILDCTVHIAFNPVTMFEISSGGADFEQEHIPGAQFVDVLSELSD